MKRTLALISRVRQLQATQAALLELRTKRLAPVDAPSILDFQVQVSPTLVRADHFRLFAGKIEETLIRPVFCAFAAPPQFGKSEITLHGLAWLILRASTKRHAYITYNLSRARKVARRFRAILDAAGIPHSGTLDCIELGNGGQVIFTSIDKGLTGEPVDGVAIIDDPYSGPQDLSAVRREVVEDSYRGVILTRVHPEASILLLATRWHPQDLTGTLIAEGWEFINLPAIAEENDANGREVGESLFPQLRPIEWLLKRQKAVGEYVWAALYQGRPRPKGGKVFHEPTFYTKLPEIFRGAYGVDLAYTEKRNADWSICVELLREDRGYQDDGEPVPPLFYVKHVDREKVELPMFVKILQLRHKLRKAWQMLWRGSGTEKGSAKLIQDRGVPLKWKQPPGDKFVSAQDVAAAWNDGRVLVPDTEKFPEAEGWLLPFLGVIGDFTGSGSDKEVDDDVDGLGNAYELLKGDPPRREEPRKKKRSEYRDLSGF